MTLSAWDLLELLVFVAPVIVTVLDQSYPGPDQVRRLMSHQVKTFLKLENSAILTTKAEHFLPGFVAFVWLSTEHQNK